MLADLVERVLRSHNKAVLSVEKKLPIVERDEHIRISAVESVKLSAQGEYHGHE